MPKSFRINIYFFTITKIKTSKIKSEHYALNHFFAFFSIHFRENKKQHIKTLCNFLKSKIKLEIR